MPTGLGFAAHDPSHKLPWIAVERKPTIVFRFRVKYVQQRVNRDPNDLTAFADRIVSLFYGLPYRSSSHRLTGRVSRLPTFQLPRDIAEGKSEKGAGRRYASL